MNKTEFFANIKNYFVSRKIQDDFIIENGEINAPLLNGQYFRIVNSCFNDGVYEYPCLLTDEEFYGEVWLMNVPPAVKELIDEITGWEQKNADALSSPYNSESFGGYSYTKSTGENGTLSWQNHFASRLNRWKKICPY